MSDKIISFEPEEAKTALSSPGENPAEEPVPVIRPGYIAPAEGSGPAQPAAEAGRQSAGAADTARKSAGAAELKWYEKPEPEDVRESAVSPHDKILEYRRQLEEQKIAREKARAEAEMQQRAEASARGNGDLPDDTPLVGRRSEYTDRDLSSKPDAGKRYVTRGALALALILGMALSTLLGAFIGARYSNVFNPAPAYENLSQSTLENATKSNMTIAEIVSQNADAVVEINTTVSMETMFGTQTGQGAGSGVIVKDNGYIATNFHVIEGAKDVTVTLRNGTEYPAQVVGYDQKNDLAVLKIAATDLATATIGDSDKLQVGNMTVAIGNPLGQLGGTATSGIVSAKDREITMDDGVTLKLLQTDSAINHGNSGGGLFSDDGTLIGIVVAKSEGTGVEGLGFAIPINTAAPIIDDIIKNGKITNKPAAGISIYTVNEDSTEHYNVEKPGVYISEVNGENAKKAGLREGDKIVRFNGESISNSTELITQIQKHKIGDKVTFTIERGGERSEISFELEDSSKFTS